MDYFFNLMNFLFILSSSVEFYYSNILSLSGGIYYSNLLSNFWADDVWPTEYATLIPILFNELIIAVINIIIGTIIALKVYKKKFGESLKFIILSQIVIYLVSMVIIIVLGLFQSLVISYHFNLQDLRVPLLVGAGIYIITVFATLRIKTISETSGKMGDKFRAAIKTSEGEDQFQGPIEYEKESNVASAVYAKAALH